jgi:uncharacterized membrane protein YeaQ/YmgE (transglycosylase-associated protein family)
MTGFAGALIAVIVVEAWGDTLERRPVLASWRRSAAVVGAFILIAAAAIGAGRLLK